MLKLLNLKESLLIRKMKNFPKKKPAFIYRFLKGNA